PRRGPTVTWTYYLESGISKYLPLVGPFDRMDFMEAQNFYFALPINLVALRQEPVAMTAYRVAGTDTSGALGDPEFAAHWAARTKGLPGNYTLQIRTVFGPHYAADQATLARLVQEVTGGAKLTAADFATR